jgi:hypothetical protein
MYLIETLSFVLAMMLVHSLLGKFGMLSAFFHPKVHAIVLRELTAINRRADLEAIFGPHDGNYRFPTNMRQIFAARPWWRWIIGNIVLEMLLIYALLGGVFGNIAPNMGLVGIAACYYAFAHFLIARSFKAARPEIEEEMAFGEQKRRERFDKLAQERRERKQGQA